MHALACTEQGWGELWCQVLEQHRGCALPIPGAHAVAQASRDRHAVQQPQGSSKAAAHLAKPAARLAQRLPAAGEPGDTAPCAQPPVPCAQPHSSPTHNGTFSTDTIQAWRCSCITTTPAHGANPGRGLDQAGEMKSEFT